MKNAVLLLLCLLLVGSTGCDSSPTGNTPDEEIVDGGGNDDGDDSDDNNDDEDDDGNDDGNDDDNDDTDDEDDNQSRDCSSPPLPSFDELPTVEALPNPFAWSDGNGTVAEKSDWDCRRAEIGAEIQHYETGNKPAPPNDFQASFSAENSTLSVTVTEGGQSLTLNAPVSVPEGDGPFPAVIGIGFTPTGSIPSDIFTSRDVATVQFNPGDIAPAGFDSGRGTGPFYDLFSSDIGNFAGWAWGISRLIDGIEEVPELNLDASRLAVTGCSFAGKIALFSGAFDERIALTIAQEPGGGGAASWRGSEVLPGDHETLAATTGKWYRSNVSRFNNSVTRLPYDHHELMAMVAPRALLILGNSAIDWLSAESAYVSSMAAQEVWSALDVPDRLGFSIVSNGSHCSLPDSQRPEAAAYVEKFLLENENADTDIARSPYDTDLTRWIDWETPDLQ